MKNVYFKIWLLVSLAIHAAIFTFILVESDFLNNFWGGGSSAAKKDVSEGVWVELSQLAVHEASTPAPKPVQKKGSDKVVSKSQPSRGGKGESITPEGGEGSGFDSSRVNRNPLVLNQIRQKIMSSRYYPTEARAQGVEGVVNLVFEIDTAGKLKAAAITQSSGDNTLDQAALVTLKRALPLPYYEGPIRIALKFALD
ncbi:MAG: hypothetical protein ACD_73C00219G0002 [uncultured bacterium]|nr:MAG: hypothetical protein ACD_73C00219G0002 [uncultured bacterium]